MDGANEEVTGQVEVYDGIVSVQQVTYTCSDGKKLTPPTSKIINCSQESHKFVPDPPTCKWTALFLFLILFDLFSDVFYSSKYTVLVIQHLLIVV